MAENNDTAGQPVDPEEPQQPQHPAAGAAGAQEQGQPGPTSHPVADPAPQFGGATPAQNSHEQATPSAAPSGTPAAAGQEAPATTPSTPLDAPAAPAAPDTTPAGGATTPSAAPGAAFGMQPGGYPTAQQGGNPSAHADSQPQLTQEYPTQALHETLAASATSPQAPSAPAQKRTHSTGTFLAGLAVAALIGGIVGGGVSSLVVANSIPKGNAVSQQGGTVKLNNPDTATDISGVAMVATPSVVTLSVESQNAAGSGSGVIYSEDGYIITNAHVVTLDGAATDPRIRVKHSDGRVFDGKLVGVAPYSDIAVVKVEAEDLTPIAVASSADVNVGDLAVAIGAPMSLSNTVTSGVVSALNRGISVGSALIPQDPSQEGQEDPRGEGDTGRGFPWDFRFDTPGEQENTQQTGGQVTLPVVQTDASINPGNSGGALLNAKGELIGINVAIASPGATEGTASSAGLGFAIPSDLAARVADEIIAGEKPTHGLLGASVVDSSLDDDEDANHAGGLIKEVVRDGAAAKAGLKVGDVITAVDGVPAADGTSVSALIRMHAGDSEVTIDYTRRGVAGQTTATLGTLDW